MDTEQAQAQPNRWLWIIPTALAVMFVNVGIHFLYMVVYGFLINPGQPEAHYHAHAQLTAPYSSILVGIPLFFFACRWLGRKFAARSAVTTALLVWLVYLLIDVTVLVLARVSAQVALLVSVSMATKLAAAYLGGRAARKRLAAELAGN